MLNYVTFKQVVDGDNVGIRCMVILYVGGLYMMILYFNIYLF